MQGKHTDWNPLIFETESLSHSDGHLLFCQSKECGDYSEQKQTIGISFHYPSTLQRYQVTVSPTCASVPVIDSEHSSRAKASRSI